jgi:hypothetical protein
MFCDRCGTAVVDSQSFCPACGKTLTIAATPVSRFSTHLRWLGILWLVISVIHLLPSLALLSIFGYGRHFLTPGVPVFVHGMLRAMGGLFLAGAVLGLIAGWGLLERQPWARMLAIVLACFSLLSMPFGTALGIYTLVVLLPAKAEQEYRRMAGTS